jgi:hypothetical protein
MNKIYKKQNLNTVFALAILTVITFIMFADILFSSGGIVLSKDGTDLTQQFIYWRYFGFRQILQGNFALWNPHIFSGMPFFSGFQSALLYPLNFLYLILPLNMAINTSIAFHVLLIGFFMYLWTAHRGLHFCACIFSSILVMFCGPYFMHIYAGHLTNLCAMIWLPLLFLSIDHLVEDFSLRWCLIGIFAVTMQILAGHPQYFYYTAITVIIYSGLCLFRTKHRLASIIGILCIYLGAIALSAIQILPGFDAANESVRSSGVSFEFASMFSFPPENLITLLIPNFFGNMDIFPYWGRCYLWEMSLFISITGITLAGYGAFYGDRNIRRFSFTMIIILLILALGVHTPLFNVLYHWLPGFNNFRGTSKFIFPLTIFLTMLAGIGLDHLIKNKYQGMMTTIVILVIGIILGGISLWISSNVFGSYDLWQQILRAIEATKESYLAKGLYTYPQFVNESAQYASKSLMNAAILCLFLSLLFSLTKHHKIFVSTIALLAVVEIFTFAYNSRPTFDIRTHINSDITKFIQEHPDDYRILNIASPNSSMNNGSLDIWGYDPGVPLRYAQFMYFTQGMNPDKATQYIHFQRIHPLYKMLRLRYLFVQQQDKIIMKDLTNNPMSRINLITNWQVINKRDDIFREMGKITFDPHRTVILEKSPGISFIQKDILGKFYIEDSSTDYLTIRGKLEQPAILLITDSYSKGWTAKPLTGSVQKSYDVMPANYILMAIPLSVAGEHHIRLEYKPTAYVVGKWISLISLAIYIIFIMVSMRKFESFLPIFKKY